VGVEVLNESGVPADTEALAMVVRHVMKELDVHPLAELSVLLVDAPAMASLHEKWMDESGPTDVMAFPMDELGAARTDDPDEEPPPTLLGDVVLCPQVAAQQARSAGHSAEQELQLLCTHGVLHLLGYDHHDDDSEREMFGLQERLLRSWRAGRRGAGG
jgi:probable rRNA maturation factor